MAQRAAGLSALQAAGIPADRIVAATGCAALAETIALTRQGVQSGCAGCLVLPPFFFKDVPEEGLFAWYARVIEAVADPRLRLFLYHIPQVTGVPVPVDLVARLAAAFPGIIAGVRTAREIGRTRPRCSSASRSSRSSSDTNLTCRDCCAPEEPGRSAAWQTSILRWSGPCSRPT